LRYASLHCRAFRRQIYQRAATVVVSGLSNVLLPGASRGGLR
jgi:hypothetical protein